MKSISKLQLKVSKLLLVTVSYVEMTNCIHTYVTVKIMEVKFLFTRDVEEIQLPIQSEKF